MVRALVRARAIATAIARATRSSLRASILKALRDIRAGKCKRFFSEKRHKQRSKQIWTLGDGSRPNIQSTYIATPGQFNRWPGKSTEI